MISKPEFNLNNKVILITGAAGHLGSAISLGIASMGGIPVLNGRDLPKLKQLLKEINATGQVGAIVHKKIETAEDCKFIIHQLEEQFNQLDGIVNCAYAGRPGTILSSTEDDFGLAQKISTQIPFFLAQFGLDLLKKTAKNDSDGASIVNIASMYGLVSPDPDIYGTSGNNNPPYYGVAKAGLIQLTRYMACHLGQYNIRVNSISPGPFPTPSIKETQPDFHEKLCSKNPLGRVGLAKELAGPVVFLLSRASSYITGANLAVDGGWTSW